MFEASKLKIERAKKHVSDLDVCVTAFFESDRYRIVLEKNPKTRESIFRLEVRGEEVPPNFALIIGDALHNLKSSLDISYYEFVSKIGGTLDTNTRFPVSDTRENLEHRIKGGSIKDFPNVQGLILDTIKPYGGGNDAIWSLHELNIADKHQLLIPLAEATRWYEVDADVGGLKLRNVSFSISQGRVISAIAVGSGAEIHIHKYGKVAGEILFQQGLPLARQPIIPSLLRITEEVTRTVKAFELFLSPIK